MKTPLAAFNIEEHARYVPVIRRPRKPRGEDNSPERPAINPRIRIVPNCQAQYGAACRCRRVSGKCVMCARDITVSVGERADIPVQHDRGKLIGYTCLRCRTRA